MIKTVKDAEKEGVLENCIYNADCLDLMQHIKSNSIDMVLTSPPYDNLRDYKGYTFDFEGIAKELYRVVKDGGVVVWVVGDATIKGSESGTSFKQALYFKEIGFNLHDTMIYNKGKCPFPDKTRYYNVFEYMFIFTKGDIKTFNPIQDRKNRCGGDIIKSSTLRQKDGTLVKTSAERNHTGRKIKEFGYRFNIWDINSGFNKSHTDEYGHQHPANFPEKLAEDHILSWSNEGDTILDPMAGSGTTLKMAKKNNRNYIGIEISPEYIDIINKRLSDLKKTR
jgi:site-specific DNA-methyltransferase (adenine-specific)